MAAAPVNPGAAGPPQPVQGNVPSAGPAVVKIIAIITQAAKQLATVFPPASPMAEEIQNQLNLAAQKVAETSSPNQPAAPPV